MPLFENGVYWTHTTDEEGIQTAKQATIIRITKDLVRARQGDGKSLPRGEGFRVRVT